MGTHRDKPFRANRITRWQSSCSPKRRATGVLRLSLVKTVNGEPAIGKMLQE